MGYIYVLKNKVNSKLYVGQTTQKPEIRIKSHLREKFIIGNAMRKYGIDNFNKFVYRDIPEEMLDIYEIELIKKLKTLSPFGYNLTEGGYVLRGEKNPFYGKKHSSETKLLMKKNHADVKKEKHPMWKRNQSEETKRKIRQSRKGKWDGKNNPNYGKNLSEETKMKLLLSQKNRKRVLCVETNKVFDSTRQAARETKTDRHNIVRCMKKYPQYKTAGGYNWEYYKENV